MTAASREALKERLDAHREDMLCDLSALVSVKSRTDDIGATRAALRFVIEKAEGWGMKTGYTSKMDAGYAEIGEGEETVGVLVHVDVVDAGDPARWPFDPFALHLTGDGFLHGRGVADDKGPAIVCLYVLRTFMELGVPLGRKLRLIVGTSEERSWTDMAHYAAEFGMPDFGFSPDGDFPIFNIEKGYCDMRLIFPETGLLDEIERAHSGQSPNSVPSKAAFKRRGREERVFAGVAAHSSVPWEGDNALLKLAAAAAAEGFCFGRFIADMFPDEFASPLGLGDGGDTYEGIFVGRTVACPTVLRKTDEGIMLNVNIRLRYGTGRARLEDAFARRADEYGYTFSVSEYTPPMMVNPRQPFLQQMLAVYRSFGYPGGVEVADGASYAAAMRNCVCFGPVFPGELSSAHMEDERISIESLMRAGLVYAEVLRALGSGSGGN